MWYPERASYVSNDLGQTRPAVGQDGEISDTTDAYLRSRYPFRPDSHPAAELCMHACMHLSTSRKQVAPEEAGQ